MGFQIFLYATSKIMLPPLWLIHKISLVVQSAVFDEGSDNINTSELSCYKIWRIKDDESLV